MTRSAGAELDARVSPEIGARIRDLRVAAGYPTPKSLTDAIGAEDFSNGMLSAIELGRRVPRISYLMLIARQLDVTVSQLVGDVDDDKVYMAGYRAALADVHEQVSELRRRGSSNGG